MDARIIAAHLVAPYRLQGKGGKNDANDAGAICEAASRPTMRFIPVKTVSNRACCAFTAYNVLADEFVVLTVSSDPEPMHPSFRGRAQRTVVQANSHAPQVTAAELLEL